MDQQNTQADDQRYFEADRVRKLNANPVAVAIKRRTLLNAGYDAQEADAKASDPTFWRPEWARLGIARPYVVNPTISGTTNARLRNQIANVDNSIDTKNYVAQRATDERARLLENAGYEGPDASEISSYISATGHVPADLDPRSSRGSVARGVAPKNLAQAESVAGYVQPRGTSAVPLGYSKTLQSLAAARSAAAKGLLESQAQPAPEVSPDSISNPTVAQAIKGGYVQWTTDYVRDAKGNPVINKATGVPTVTKRLVAVQRPVTEGMSKEQKETAGIYNAANDRIAEKLGMDIYGEVPNRLRALETARMTKEEELAAQIDQADLQEKQIQDVLGKQGYTRTGDTVVNPYTGKTYRYVEPRPAVRSAAVLPGSLAARVLANMPGPTPAEIRQRPGNQAAAASVRRLDRMSEINRLASQIHNENPDYYTEEEALAEAMSQYQQGVRSSNNYIQR